MEKEIHTHRFGGVQRAGGTVYAWPGCMEGRGFDETGEKGVLSEKFTPLISVFAFLRLSCVSSARSVLAHHLSADKSIHLPCMIFQNHIYVNFLQFFSKYVLTEQKG